MLKVEAADAFLIGQLKTSCTNKRNRLYTLVFITPYEVIGESLVAKMREWLEKNHISLTTKIQSPRGQRPEVIRPSIKPSSFLHHEPLSHAFQNQSAGPCFTLL
jgi:hypothetical protein